MRSAAPRARRRPAGPSARSRGRRRGRAVRSRRRGSRPGRPRADDSRLVSLRRGCRPPSSFPARGVRNSTRFATTSTALRLLPSESSQELLRRRPSTPTLRPFSRYWAHSSACLFQVETRTKSASSFPGRSTASTKFATCRSSPTSLSSTSVARFPISVTTFTRLPPLLTELGNASGKEVAALCRNRAAFQSGCPDLNWGPLRPERSALPGCATPREVTD